MVNDAPLVWSGPGWSPGLSQLLGGKGANLARLRGAGQLVPPMFVVTTEAFAAAIEDRGLLERIRLFPGGRDEKEEAAEIRKALEEGPLPAGLPEKIDRAHRDAFPGEAFVAVRSSASDEDSSGHAFAGLHDSFLFVRGAEAVKETVRKVWASAFSDRAVTYRRERGLTLAAARVAVVVQRMVDARASGVAFTADPVNGNAGEIVVNALLGAGEGLVGAGFDADGWTIEKKSLSVRARIVQKTQSLVFDSGAGRGLKTEDVPQDLRGKPCLGDDQVLAVASAGLVIEWIYGRPQDIEFCFDDAGILFILQARPITTVEEYGPAAGNRLIWDNSNIVESYSGVTTPMTFSFIRRAYTIVYHCFASVMGVPPATVRDNAATFENMLGLHRGRVYYNILNWYRLIRLFPGFGANRRFMESMMGVKEPADLTDAPPTPSFARKLFVEVPALVGLFLRSSWNFLRIRGIVAKFEARFRHYYGRWSKMDFRTKAPHELLATYREMEKELLWNWKAPIINDFFVMIFCGTLKKLCASWCGDKEGSLQNDLLSGEGGLESTEPANKLIELAATARKDPALREAIASGDAGSLAASLPTDPRFPVFTAELAKYLDLYGFRCMDELKLEASSLRDDPRFVFQILKNHLLLEKPEAMDPKAALEREKKVRWEAEARAAGKIAETFHLFPRGMVFRWVLRNARLGVKNRENMRFARTRIYGVLREMIRAMGEKLVGEKILDSRDDIFYLRLDEVWDFMKGTAESADLRGLAALRRKEFDGYRAAEAPDSRFETWGFAYNRNKLRNPVAPPAATGGGLRGVGCSPGVVVKQAKVVYSPADDMRLSGEILVAERTDPGWVPLYPFVSGILVERGSILSHSAIAAREMGIPTIVGIPGLLKAVASGQWVKMDGSTGTIELLDGPPSTGATPGSGPSPATPP